jgi:hypothetical protein
MFCRNALIKNVFMENGGVVKVGQVFTNSVPNFFTTY